MLGALWNKKRINDNLFSSRHCWSWSAYWLIGLYNKGMAKPKYLPRVTLNSRFRACTPPRRNASVVVWIASVVLRTANVIVLLVVASVESSSTVTFAGARVCVRFKSRSMAGTCPGAEEWHLSRGRGTARVQGPRNGDGHKPGPFIASQSVHGIEVCWLQKIMRWVKRNSI